MIPDIVHYFAKGIYAKETHIPAGLILVQHKHAYDHLSVLAQGTVKLDVDGVHSVHVAPCCLTIKAGKHHGILALTDAVWYCIHHDDTELPGKLEDAKMVIRRLDTP